MWNVLDTGVATAEENMRIDTQLLQDLKRGDAPTLHFYEWSADSASYGYFVDPSSYLDLSGVKKRGLSLARRPTGGGIVFHIWDLAFSVLIPASHPQFSMNTLENYAMINEPVLGAVRQFLGKEGELILTETDAASFDPSCARFCMARPTKYDVMLHGRKIAGAAQRRTKEGFLHQGTISLLMPNTSYLEEVLLPGTQVLDAMASYTFPLLGQKGSEQDLPKVRSELKKLLFEQLTT